MSREIKFRAFVKPILRFANRQVGFMIDVSEIDFNEKYVANDDGTVYYFDEIELVQYAGLKDKNGNEVHEGDIDQAENGDKSVIVFLLKAGTYCVMPMDIYLNNDYQNEAFFPDFIYGFGYDLFFDNCTPEKYLNIIGNIYENPKLLEETEC